LLAADRVSAAAALPTSSPKTRVRGSRWCASGRLSQRARRRPINTPGSRACAYKTASGRFKWLSRDPIEESGGLNLYQFVFNNPLSKFDVLGLDPCGKFVIRSFMVDLAAKDAAIRHLNAGDRVPGFEVEY